MVSDESAEYTLEELIKEELTEEEDFESKKISFEDVYWAFVTSLKTTKNWNYYQFSRTTLSDIVNYRMMSVYFVPIMVKANSNIEFEYKAEYSTKEYQHISFGGYQYNAEIDFVFSDQPQFDSINKFSFSLTSKGEITSSTNFDSKLMDTDGETKTLNMDYRMKDGFSCNVYYCQNNGSVLCLWGLLIFFTGGFALFVILVVKGIVFLASRKKRP